MHSQKYSVLAKLLRNILLARIPMKGKTGGGGSRGSSAWNSNTPELIRKKSTGSFQRGSTEQMS
jgi:hypothetical protein